MEQDIAIGHVEAICVGVADTDESGPLLVNSRRFGREGIRVIFKIYDSFWRA
jgi:hypothetical protein